MLKTDFKDDVFSGNRKYNLVNNVDGTVSLVDATEYQQQGDMLSANELNQITGEVNKKSDAVLQAAGGTANAIELNNVQFIDGFSITFIVASNNSSTATTINGKQLYKPGTTKAPNLIAGKAYTVWYDLAGDCFFLKASAEGDAVAANVLAGKKFSNDSDTGIEGEMPDNGAVNHAMPINGTYIIPKGYHNGLGKVNQSLPTKGAAIITPGTADQSIAAGQYLSGAQTIKGDADLIPSKLPLDLNLFGVQGTRSLGKKFASGTANGSSSGHTFQCENSGTTSRAYINIANLGLTFTPRIILLTYNGYLNALYFADSLSPYGVGKPYKTFLRSMNDFLYSPTNPTYIAVQNLYETYNYYAWE